MRRLLKTHPPSSGSPVVRVRITVGRLFASLLSWRDSGTHPPAWQDLFLKPQTVIGAWITAFCVSRAMWVEMDGDEGGGGGGGGGTGDERKLITWHKPAHPSLTHLSVRSRDGGEGGRGWRRWRRRTYRVSWLDSWLTKEGRVRGGGHTQVDVHMWEHTRLYSIITSCVAPDDPDDFNTRNSRGFFSSKVCLALTSCTQLLEYSDGWSNIFSFGHLISNSLSLQLVASQHTLTVSDCFARFGLFIFLSSQEEQRQNWALNSKCPPGPVVSVYQTWNVEVKVAI